VLTVIQNEDTNNCRNFYQHKTKMALKEKHQLFSQMTNQQQSYTKHDKRNIQIYQYMIYHMAELINSTIF